MHDWRLIISRLWVKISVADVAREYARRVDVGIVYSGVGHAVLRMRKVVWMVVQMPYEICLVKYAMEDNKEHDAINSRSKRARENGQPY